MVQRFFLGANSAQGFYSLYGGFPPGSSAFLHVIKGGPGTGKSSFMRAIGREAEQRGQDVQYVLCSGDPDSLDGVYLPQQKVAWVDGTAPHAREPAAFQVDSDYVNLGAFCRGPIHGFDARRIRELLRENRALNREAGRYLCAAGALTSEPEPPSPLLLAQLKELLEPLAAENTVRDAYTSPRFLHAICCKGELWLTEELLALCPRLIRVSQGALDAVRRCGGLRCLSPLCPNRIEALLFPEASLALIDGAWPLTVELDLSPCAALTQEAADREAETRRLIDRAVTRLRQAKALHDELEGLYQRYMDFPALDRFTQEQLDALFS